MPSFHYEEIVLYNNEKFVTMLTFVLREFLFNWFHHYYINSEVGGNSFSYGVDGKSSCGPYFYETKSPTFVQRQFIRCYGRDPPYVQTMKHGMRSW